MLNSTVRRQTSQLDNGQKAWADTSMKTAEMVNQHMRKYWIHLAIWCSVAQLCPVLHNPMDCSTPGFQVFHCLLGLLRLMPIESVVPSTNSSSVTLSPPAFSLSQHHSLMLFPMRQLCASGGLSIGASALASVFPMNIQGLFPLGLTGLIFLSKWLSRVFSTTVWEHQFFGT